MQYCTDAGAVPPFGISWCFSRRFVDAAARLGLDVLTVFAESVSWSGASIAALSDSYPTRLPSVSLALLAACNFGAGKDFWWVASGGNVS